MFADTPVLTAGQVSEPQEGYHQAACPVCTGLLVPLGGFWRCSRCCFTLCEGCDGGPVAVAPDGCK